MLAAMAGSTDVEAARRAQAPRPELSVHEHGRTAPSSETVQRWAGGIALSARKRDGPVTASERGLLDAEVVGAVWDIDLDPIDVDMPSGPAP